MNLRCDTASVNQTRRKLNLTVFTRRLMICPMFAAVRQAAHAATVRGSQGVVLQRDATLSVHRPGPGSDRGIMSRLASFRLKAPLRTSPVDSARFVRYAEFAVGDLGCSAPAPVRVPNLSRRHEQTSDADLRACFRASNVRNDVRQAKRRPMKQSMREVLSQECATPNATTSPTSDNWQDHPPPGHPPSRNEARPRPECFSCSRHWRPR